MSDFIDVVSFTPPNFFSKCVNEEFTKLIMSQVIGQGKWLPGDPTVNEPDYFCNGIPLEFTLASDRKKKGNYIQRIMRHQYSTEDAESDISEYIIASVDQKIAKNYSVPNVHLCILCYMDLTNWVLDEYGSVTHCLVDDRRQSLFETVYEKCIESGKFYNVFIIFPDLTAKWWVWDVSTNKKASIQLSREDILSEKYPYVIASHEKATFVYDG